MPGTSASTRPTKGEKIATTITTPRTLKRVWAIAARRAETVPPMAASWAVMVVPMFSPMTRATAVWRGMAPVAARAMVMPSIAELLWTIMVITQPMRTQPKMLTSDWASRISIRFLKPSSLRSGLKASLMISRPKKIIPRATRTLALAEIRSFLEKIIGKMPRPMSSSPYLPILTARIQPVIVVPMFAPRITPIAWVSCIRPALVRPTTMTVVIVED